MLVHPESIDFAKKRINTSKLSDLSLVNKNEHLGSTERHDYDVETIASIPSMLVHPESINFAKKRINTSKLSDLSVVSKNKHLGSTERHDYDVDYLVEHQILPSAAQIKPSLERD